MAPRKKIIIDGYNFILRFHDITPGQDDALYIAREQFIHKVISFRGNKAMDIIIVFDGQDIKGLSKQHRPAGIKVMFSKAPQKADPLILKLLDQAADTRHITLVTSDRGLAHRATLYQCNIQNVEEFAASMRRPVIEKPREIEKKYNSSQMSQSELDEWLRLFNEKDTD
ncbi:MAG: NYN domain-containing protein [candidate division KSB1 bacterium]|nr:NYN domain-containing protein [candidate division KSB1 bacterium]